MRWLVTLVWIIVITVLLILLGHGREVAIFDIIILLFVSVQAVVSYVVGKKAGISLELVPEITRGTGFTARLHGCRWFKLVPHSYSVKARYSGVHLSRVDASRFVCTITRRGFYDKSLLQVTWGDLLGFFLWTRDISLVRPCWVYPRREQVSCATGVTNGEHVDERLVEAESYSDVRRVHWQATARTGQLLVRQNVTCRKRLWLVAVFAGGDGEEIADTAASWLRFLSEKQLPVAAAVIGRQSWIIPEGMGMEHEKRVLRALALAEGPLSEEELFKVVNHIGVQDKVLLIGELPEHAGRLFADTVAVGTTSWQNMELPWVQF